MNILAFIQAHKVVARLAAIIIAAFFIATKQLPLEFFF